MRLPARRLSEHGSVLLPIVIVTMVMGFLMAAYLQGVRLRSTQAANRLGSMRALYSAFGELEMARVAISDSEYVGTGNTMIQQALESPDKKVPGTNVVVERIGEDGSPWYNLVATAPYDVHYERVVTQAVREVNYFSSYNLFVRDHPVGISGSPIGSIHSNEQVEFYLPDGNYVYPVTATNGFRYLGGATEDNTTLTGSYDPAADPIYFDLENDPEFGLAAVKSHADSELVLPDNVQLTFFRRAGAQWVRIKDGGNALAMEIPKKLPTFNSKNAHNQRNKKRKSGGDNSGTLGFGADAVDGDAITDKGRKGTEERTEVEANATATPAAKKGGSNDDGDDDDDDEAKTPKKPKTTKFKTRNVRLGDEAVIYVEGNVVAVSGDIVSRVTVAAEGTILIRNNLIYKDPRGRTAYVNGRKPTKPYLPNSSYDGEASLGLIARDHVLVSVKAPSKLEINASLVAINGRVGISGIELDDLGTVMSYNPKYRKDSLRRLGGVTSAQRPVDTYARNGFVLSGFRKGVAIFDATAIASPPPFFVAMPEPTFFATTIRK